ncbi:MAG: response regulator transcription factor [Anaerolineae bacterium]|nr:response regulator transcription factor [Anaerolineae bacterium]
MGKQTIFIVEDEATIREVVRKYLELEGFIVLEASSGTQALTMLREQTVDLILLDVMLPGIDGFDVTRSIRREREPGFLAVNGTIPIIMLTSRKDESDRLVGFELGVDDYIPKPFSPREVVARVKAVLRRANPGVQISDQPIRCGDMLIDPTKRSVVIGDKRPDLTVKEFDLLYFLAQHPEQVFTRDQVLNSVWGFEFYGDESTVTVHIRRLREKIEPNPAEPTYIQTVWGVGYKFEGRSA